MTYEFDRDTAVSALGNGRYAAKLDRGWLVGGGVNGGYLLATMARAVAAQVDGTGHTDPFSMSAHYVSASVPGLAVVAGEVVRTTGRFSTVRAVLEQDVDSVAVPRIAAHATFGNLDAAHDERSDAEAAALGLAL